MMFIWTEGVPVASIVFRQTEVLSTVPSIFAKDEEQEEWPCGSGLRGGTPADQASNQPTFLESCLKHLLFTALLPRLRCCSTPDTLLK
jgi:hypothetical protein